MNCLNKHLCLSGILLLLVLAGSGNACDQMANQSVIVDGINRSFTYIAPCRDDQPLPVVIAYHFSGGNPAAMADMIQISDFARTHGFIAVFPRGSFINTKRRWDDNRGWVQQGTGIPIVVDEVGFLVEIIEFLSTNFIIDTTNINVTGIANGAGLVYRFMCSHDEILERGGFEISGFMPVSSTMPEYYSKGVCSMTPGSKIRALNGTADTFAKWCTLGEKLTSPRSCDVPDSNGTLSAINGDMGSVMSTKDKIKETLICKGYSLTATDDYPEPENTSIISFYHDCLLGDYDFHRINNGGHNWPGGNVPELQSSGEVSLEINATQMLVEMMGF